RELRAPARELRRRKLADRARDVQGMSGRHPRALRRTAGRDRGDTDRLRPVVRRVVERGFVGAAAQNREPERRPGVDVDQIAEQLAAGLVVAGNHAGDGLMALDGLPRTDLDLAWRAAPAAPRRV